MTHRQYSDNEKAEALIALDANGGNVNKTARQLKIPRKTLEEWRDGRHHPEVAEIRQRGKKELSARMVEIAFDILDAMPAKAKDSYIQSLAVSLGILIEKIQLLDGEPTDRHEHRVTNAERAARAAELFNTAGARRAGQPPVDGDLVQ